VKVPLPRDELWKGRWQSPVWVIAVLSLADMVYFLADKLTSLSTWRLSGTLVPFRSFDGFFFLALGLLHIFKRLQFRADPHCH
jgi:hypothetical protein